MSNIIQFTTTNAVPEGKQGKLKQTKEGYYEILAGAYNIENSAGEFYVLTDKVKRLFKNSTMVRWWQQNQLYSEIDHPSLDSFRSKTNNDSKAVSLWISRLGRIDPNNLACQIHSFRLDKLPYKVDNKDVYGVFLTIEPFAPALKQMLANPSNNTAFSVRSFVNRYMQLGQMFCETKDILTWDWVPHGGIHVATKYNTPSLESATKPKILTVSEAANMDAMVVAELERMESQSKAVGMESNTIITSKMVKNLVGEWQEVVDLGKVASLNW